MQKPQPFKVAELYEAVANDIDKLRFHGVENEGLTIEDRVYINGKDIRDSLTTPLKRPSTHIENQVLEALKSSFGYKARYYKSIRTIAWQGELINSAFYRFGNFGSQLLVEVAFFVLCPIADRYKEIDRWDRLLDLRDLFEVISEGFRPRIFLRYIFLPLSNVLSTLGNKIGRRRRHRELEKAMLRDPDFDYGAKTTSRELGTDARYNRYFQEVDSQLFEWLLQKQIVDSVIDFLEKHHIDTSELKETRTSLQNMGVIVSGGSVTTQNIIAGSGAKGIVNKLRSNTNEATKQQ
jgi:hypothetical protein